MMSGWRVAAGQFVVLLTQLLTTTFVKILEVVSASWNSTFPQRLYQLRRPQFRVRYQTDDAARQEVSRIVPARAFRPKANATLDGRERRTRLQSSGRFHERRASHCGEDQPLSAIDREPSTNPRATEVASALSESVSTRALLKYRHKPTPTGRREIVPRRGWQPAATT